MVSKFDSDFDFSPDHKGECDMCHAWDVPCWTDWGNPGEWCYCESCYYVELSRRDPTSMTVYKRRIKEEG